MQDLTKPTLEILVDLINISNRHVPTYSPYGYGALQFKDVARMPDGSSRNSTIKVADMAAVNDSDWMSLYYDRVPLSRPLNRVQPTLRYDEDFTSTHDLLPALNERFRLNLQPEDIVDEPITFDPETDEFPFTITLTAEAGGEEEGANLASTIYYGTASIDLLDPAIGTGIVIEVGRSVESLPDYQLTPEDKFLAHETFDGDLFLTGNNGELIIGASVAHGDAARQPPDYEDSRWVYPINLIDGDWVFQYSFGLQSVVNGENPYDLYKFRMIVEAHGRSNFDLTLFKEGNNYIFRSQDRTIAITPETFVTEDNGTLFQGLIKLSDFPDVISEESKTAEGAALGSFRFILIAERREGDVPAVSVELVAQPTTQPNVAVLLFKGQNTLQLIESPTADYLLDFTVQVALTGPAGIPLALPNDIELVTSMSNIAQEFEPAQLIRNGITLDDSGGIIPEGLNKGIYDLVGQLVIDHSQQGGIEEGDTISLSILYEDLNGDPQEALVEWGIALPVAEGQPPTLDESPTIDGTPTVGEILTLNHGAYFGTEPLTIVCVLEESINITGVLVNSYPIEHNQTTFNLDSEHVGHRFALVETVTNAYGSYERRSPMTPVVTSGEGGDVTLTSPPNIVSATYNGEADAFVEWTPVIYEGDAGEVFHSLFRIQPNVAPIMLASTNPNDGLPTIDDYVLQVDDVGGYLVISYYSYDVPFSGESEVYQEGTGNIGFSWTHAAIDTVPEVLAMSHLGHAPHILPLIPGLVDGLSNPVIIDLRWYNGSGPDADSWNAYESQTIYTDTGNSLSDTVEGPGDVTPLAIYMLWGGWTQFYVKGATFDVNSSEADAYDQDNGEGSPEIDSIDVADSGASTLYADVSVTGGNWSGITVDDYLAVIYESDSVGVIDRVRGVNRVWFNPDHPLDGLYFVADVYAISGGQLYGPQRTGAFSVPSAAPNLLPISIYWDAESRAFNITEPEFDGPILDDGGDVPNGDFIPATAMQWKINGETLYRDYKPSEAGFNTVKLLPSDVILGHVLGGATLSGTASVRFRLADGWHYATIEVADFLVEANTWSSHTSAPNITAYDPELATATFTEAVWADIPEGWTQGYYATVFDSERGGSGAQTGAIPTADDFVEGKEYFLVVQSFLEDESNNRRESVYSNLFSSTRGDLGFMSDRPVCSERPQILRYVEGDDAPIIYPGLWDFKAPDGSFTSRGQYGLNLYTGQLPDPMFNLFEWGETNTGAEGPITATDQVVSWVAVKNVFNDEFTTISVRSGAYDVLGGLEGESHDLASLDAPAIATIPTNNTFTLTGGEDLTAFADGRTYLLWAAKFEGYASYALRSVVEFDVDEESFFGDADLVPADQLPIGQSVDYKVAIVHRAADGSLTFSDWSVVFTVNGTLGV